MNRSFWILAFLLGGFSSSAEGQQLAASLRAGTQGLGAGVTVGLRPPMLNGRLGAHFFSYSTTGTRDADDVAVAYDADARFLFVSALADWHPLRNTFRMSAGLLYNGLESKGVLTPDESVEAGNTTYTPDQVGELSLDVSSGSKFSPYVGLGIGNALGGRIGFLADLGLIYVGSPTVDMEASGMLRPTAREAAQIEQNLSWIHWYPIVSIGISARLF